MQFSKRKYNAISKFWRQNQGQKMRKKCNMKLLAHHVHKQLSHEFWRQTKRACGKCSCVQEVSQERQVWGFTTGDRLPWIHPGTIRTPEEQETFTSYDTMKKKLKFFNKGKKLILIYLPGHFADGFDDGLVGCAEVALLPAILPNDW